MDNTSIMSICHGLANSFKNPQAFSQWYTGTLIVACNMQAHTAVNIFVEMLPFNELHAVAWVGVMLNKYIIYGNDAGVV